MNQKDYKKIAEIIESRSGYSPAYSPQTICRKIATELAEYFEKERYFGYGEDARKEKQQFLKDCGV